MSHDLQAAAAAGIDATPAACATGNKKGPPPARPSWSRMQSTTRSRGRCAGGFGTESKYSHGDWQVPLDFDYCRSTAENYRCNGSGRAAAAAAGGGGGDSCNDVSQYQAVRATRDQEYHGTYTRERQLFQDALVKNVVGASSRKEHPWIVFTAGAMGAGKSYTIRWMSEKGYFPLPDIVTVDPDLFKTAFPEWPGYLQNCAETAGSLTRRESGYLVEIAQEVAMQQMKNVWVDGSLRDSKWYEQVVEDIRKNHPAYRIAILYVHANEEQVLGRARRRAEETGRVVPDAEIKDSLYRVPRTVAILMPKADFVAYIKNDDDQPRLIGYCDWNGCHRNVLGDWNEIKDRFATLPEFGDRTRWTTMVEQSISMPGVLVFSKTYCSFCAKLKALLRELRIPFRTEELDKTTGGAAMQLVLGSRPSSRCLTVPQLFASGRFIGGCSDALVLHTQGKLEPMLRVAAGQAVAGGEAALPPPSTRWRTKSACPEGTGESLPAIDESVADSGDAEREGLLRYPASFNRSLSL
ncbi:unnamed protein product [Pylaiella littoralis]